LTVSLDTSIGSLTTATRYWDETIDAGNFSGSILLDPVYGFGGDGANGSLCITTGPFASYQNPIGPGYTLSPHCITRDIGGFPEFVDFSLASTQFVVDSCLNHTEWVDFWPCIEVGPHGGGHGGVNGQVSVFNLSSVAVLFLEVHRDSTTFTS
jgi:tyrosinase